MRASILFIILLWMQLGWSQTTNLNAYEYVIVPMQFDFQSESNQYQLNILSRVLLKEKGFKVFMDKEEKPLEVRSDICKSLRLKVIDEGGFLTTKLKAQYFDCYNRLVYETEEGTSRIKAFDKSYKDALRKAFETMPVYKFDPSLTTNILQAKNEEGDFNQLTQKEQILKAKNNYPDKKIYKFGGETYWLIENGNKGFSILTKEGKVNYAELQNADKGTYIFNSETINGAAFFDAEGNINIEYMDKDLGEIQNITFRKIN